MRSLLWTPVVKVISALWVAFFHWSIVLGMLIGLFGGIFDKFDDIDRFDVISVGLAISRCADDRRVQERVLGGEDVSWMICLFTFICYYSTTRIIIAFLLGISKLDPQLHILTPHPPSA